MRIVIFLFLILTLNFNSYAYYFSYDLPTNVLKPNIDYTVGFNYELKNISASDFFVRPVLQNAILLIYNSTTDSWVFATQPWEFLPALSDVLKIKVISNTQNNGSLYFEVLNKRKGEILNTQKRTFWFYSIYAEYLVKLNARINQ